MEYTVPLYVAESERELVSATAELLEHAVGGSRRAQGEFKDLLLGNAESGSVFAQESHSTSDLPVSRAFNIITNAEFQRQLAQRSPIRERFTRTRPVNDLRPQYFYSLDYSYDNMPTVSGDKRNYPGGTARVGELTEFPAFSFSFAEQSYGIAKHGARVEFSYEMLLNDQWNIVEELPLHLAEMATNQQDIVSTEVLASETGPNADFFNAANGNLIAGNPALSLESVQEAVASISTRTVNGRPVEVPRLALMVPPALELEARRITSIGSYEHTDGANTFVVNNPINGLEVIVNRWLPVIDESANANTTWYIVPVQGGGTRPSVLYSPLRGKETPELRAKDSESLALGGGRLAPREGSFDNDGIQYRVRQHFGSVAMYPDATAVSLGTNA